mgnify:FL=1
MENNMILTVIDIKAILKIGNDKAYKLFHQRSFPSFSIGGKHYIKRDDFEQWLENIKKLPDRNYKL